MKEKDFEYYVGIDEVGRGPLAGPVTICAAAFKVRAPKFLEGIKDSKKLTAKKREGWLKKFKIAQEEGSAIFCLASSDHTQIDVLGLTKAIKNAIEKGLKKLNLDPCKCLVLLDGGLKAPEEYIHQETIIKGDEKELVIAAASIVAKVSRDKVMIKYGEKYSEYGFDLHKGYGTKTHYEAIDKHGPCDIHRKSFLNNFCDKINIIN